MPSLPDAARYLAPVLGRWSGEGRGLWAADPPLRYHEDVVFATNGKAFVSYVQATRAADDGRPLHGESGFLRATKGDEVELLVVQPIGLAEVHEGHFDGATLALRLVHLARTSTAKAVTAVERVMVFGPDTLDYRLRLAMNDEPLADHLEGHLRRVG